jgi:hypothetical protein
MVSSLSRDWRDYILDCDADENTSLTTGICSSWSLNATASAHMIALSTSHYFISSLFSLI